MIESIYKYLTFDRRTNSAGTNRKLCNKPWREKRT